MTFDADAILAGKKALLDEVRPLSPKGIAALSTWYDVELTYTSNAIEGNSLTRSETCIVLEKGITIGGKPLKDHLEAVGHKDALGYVREIARSLEPIRENDVRQIHSLVMGRVDPQGAGRYADFQRLISGTSYVPPSPAELVPLMGDFGQWLAKAPDTAETAFKAHERVAVIHPFEDGNGRTARLLMNLVLLKGGYPPVVIGPDQRSAYIESLNAITEGNDTLRYREFMTERLDNSLSHYLDMLRRGPAANPLGHSSEDPLTVIQHALRLPSARDGPNASSGSTAAPMAERLRAFEAKLAAERQTSPASPQTASATQDTPETQFPLEATKPSPGPG